MERPNCRGIGAHRKLNQRYRNLTAIVYLSEVKKSITTLLLLFITLFGYSQIERDKALHFVGGNLFGLAGAGIAKQISDGSRFWTFAGAVGGATFIGIGKEAVDASQRPNGWDNDDLLATILGGVTVGLTIDLVTAKKRKAKKREKFSVSFNDDGAFYYLLKEELSGDNLPALSTIGLSKHAFKAL